MQIKKISSKAYYVVIVLLCVAIIFFGARIIFKLFIGTSTDSSTTENDILQKNGEIIDAYLNLDKDKTELEASRVKGENLIKNPSKNIDNFFLRVLLNSNCSMQIAYEQEHGVDKDFGLITPSIAMIFQDFEPASYLKSQFPAIVNILNLDDEDNSLEEGDSTAVLGKYDPDNDEDPEKDKEPVILENIILVEEVEAPEEAGGILIYEQSLQQLGINFSENEGIHGYEIAAALGVKPIEVNQDKPYVLIYHTHGSESYYPEDVDNYHSINRSYNITNIGEIVAQGLNTIGHNTMHEDKHHDNPALNGSYTRSLETAKNILLREENIRFIFDIHRDGVKIKNQDIEMKTEKYLTEAERFITEINGKNVARFSFVVGPETPNREEIIRFAKYIKAVSDVMYPGLCRGIIEKPYGMYNQYLSDYYALIEVGSNINTVDEAEESGKLISEILDKAISGLIKENEN